jgi:hypothetical protein
MEYRAGPRGSRAVVNLQDQGFDLPPVPSDMEVELPPDVSAVDSSELMRLFGLFTAWCDYATAQVGLAAIDERQAERTVERKEAEAWRDLPKSSVSAAKALVALDLQVQKAQNELDECHAYRRVVSDIAARYERDAALLSRELTRRTSEAGPKSSRRERWGNG